MIVPTVAIFPWGDVIEDFLDPIGLSLTDFLERMTGGWLFGYVAALKAAGWNVVIVCVSEAVGRPQACRHTGTGARVWVVPGRRASTLPRRPSRRTLAQWFRTPMQAFARVLRDEGCSCVVTQEYEYARFDALALLCAWLRLPLFATFQGGDVTLSPLEGRVRRTSLDHCSGLIIASARERERVARCYPGLRTPVVDIPNPLDTNEWKAIPKAQARVELGVADDAFLVVNHGRIDVRRKGLDVLLAAWQRFSARCPQARLHLIGAGQDNDEFARLLHEQSSARITWDCRYTTDRPLIRTWLSAADVYVTTSRTEGMPVAPLEALACGLPVIASRAQGLAEILPQGEQSGGILVDCDDADATSGALERLSANQALRESLSQAGRRHVVDAFSLAAVGHRLVGFMNKTMATTA